MNLDNTVWKLISDLKGKKGITEIVLNGPEDIFVERGGEFIQLNNPVTIEDMNSFIADVAKYNNCACDENEPLLNGTIEDGSRVNAVTTPISGKSPAITIRRYEKSIKTFKESPGIFGLNEQWLPFFKSLITSKMNIIVSGGTGVGKTTLMNLLLNEIPKEERVVTIEDTREIQFDLPNKVQLECNGTAISSKVKASDLVRNSLRMRPDRIIIGEIRGGEIFDLLQAMNTGHEGSMSSIHANSPAECLSRMEVLYLLSGHHLPIHVVRRHIASAVDFIIQIERNKKGQRFVSSVLEVTGMESENILSHTILSSDGSRLTSSGIAPQRMQILNERSKLSLDFFNN